MDKEERYNGYFTVTVRPNDERTRVKGVCAARYATLRMVTELGQVHDIRIYQGGYVVIRGRRWLDRNLLESRCLTDNAVPCGLDMEQRMRIPHLRRAFPVRAVRTRLGQFVRNDGRRLEPEHGRASGLPRGSRPFACRMAGPPRLWSLKACSRLATAYPRMRGKDGSNWFQTTGSRSFSPCRAICAISTATGWRVAWKPDIGAARNVRVSMPMP